MNKITHAFIGRRDSASIKLDEAVTAPVLRTIKITAFMNQMHYFFVCIIYVFVPQNGFIFITPQTNITLKIIGNYGGIELQAYHENFSLVIKKE